MECPEKGSFPLLGLESKRVVVLDEWRFNERVIGMSTQLLWFEGKPLLLPQPQNTGSTGHLLCRGSAPIFAITKRQFLETLEREAKAAEAADAASAITQVEF